MDDQGEEQAKPSAEPASQSDREVRRDVPPLTARQRFLKACQCLPVDRTPVWLMRQAGRVLPEYRVLKGRHSFLELVRTPELAAEVSMQPIRRFGFDAAILFSDILVIPEAMGLPYRFRESGGIQLDHPIRETRDIDRLDPDAVTERLQYVAEAIRILRKELGDQTALIGFAGAPWTLANFMLEGGSVRVHSMAKALYYRDPGLFTRLLEKLTRAAVLNLQMQAAAGADAVQVFESLGGELADNLVEPLCLHWVRRIITAVRPPVPVILFARGVHGCWDALAATGAHVISVDCTVRLAHVRTALPESVGVQGNLDPRVLASTPLTVATETRRILNEMRGSRGHIFNLGHGVPPDARLENIASLVETVRSFR
jgi:uroporphyrinogen decarboxylase